MKKRKFGILAFTFTLVLGVIVGIVTNKNDISINAEDNEIKVSYVKKGSYKDMGDNWIYFFDILDYKDNDNDYYVFDGYNLKYMYLEDYSIKMVDAERNEVSDKIVSETPILARSDIFGDEVVRINEYFNKRQFRDKISEKDITDLETSHFSKNLIIELFNNAIESEAKTKPGKYILYSHLGKVRLNSTVEKYEGEWEITYINDFGTLSYVTVDMKLKDGSYLSDKQEYKELLNSISKEIESKQSFNNIESAGKSKLFGNDINTLLIKADKSVNTIKK
jgi:hypothetical protein